MQRVTVTGRFAEFHSGIIELSPAQAEPRLSSLDNLGEGLYQIKSAVQFKCGEELGYDGEINKALLAVLKTKAKGKK